MAFVWKPLVPFLRTVQNRDEKRFLSSLWRVRISSSLTKNERLPYALILVFYALCERSNDFLNLKILWNYGVSLSFRTLITSTWENCPVLLENQRTTKRKKILLEKKNKTTTTTGFSKDERVCVFDLQNTMISVPS